MSASRTDYGDLHVIGRDAGAEHPCVRFSSTTPDAGAEVSLMTNYLELERAHRLRGVVIAPHAVGSLIVVSPNVSVWTLVRGFLKERARARAAIAKAARRTP